MTGGTGFIGTRLIKILKKNNHEVLVLSRKSKKKKPSVHIINTLGEVKPNQSIDVIINLAGAPIDKRWSASYKNKLIDSRVDTTKALIQWMKQRNEQPKPKVFISASAIGYYGAQDATELHEFSSSIHDDFTHNLCYQWELAALDAQKVGIRTCIIRLGVVLGKSGGALKKMLPAFRLGLGGRLGSGKQYVSWVHIYDVCHIILFLMDNEHLSGAFNVTAPHAVTNKTLTKSLARVLKRTAHFAMPACIVKLIFGEMGDVLLLKGQNIIPKRLMDAGFKFKFSHINTALKSILK